MKPRNLLVIMSDEHNPRITGYAGHPIVSTPNLDALARRGTVFRRAYTTSPVCVPARAGFAAGKYIHQIGYWDNADAYDGRVPSWHHLLRDRGHRVVSIGKLHFRQPGEDHGFSEEQIPMHILEGKGDLMGLVREDLPRRGSAAKMARYAGPGETAYTFYDREIASRAVIWLREEARRYRDRPWVLFVSFVAPHFPLTAPPEHFYRYASLNLPLPKLYQREERTRHPYLDDYRSSFCYDDYFESEAQVRRALAGYLGLVSYVDENIGRVLAALEDIGGLDETTLLYTSDHGDNLGARGLWGKSTMYEEIAGVPCIAAGPDIPAGQVVDTPVSHVDFFPTLVEGAGHSFASVRDEHPGVSLYRIAAGERPDRTVLSEYHGMGSTTGAFAVWVDAWKYVHYAGYPPQLYNLDRDPEEILDIAGDPAHAHVVARCQQKLFALCDPIAVDRRAKARQAELLAQHGGREAVIARGDLGFTPAPGAAVEFS
jgi:choline-sulfatase